MLMSFSVSQTTSRNVNDRIPILNPRENLFPPPASPPSKHPSRHEENYDNMAKAKIKNSNRSDPKIHELRSQTEDEISPLLCNP